MNKVMEFLLNTIKLKDGDTIVLGNSAGPDSMCLLNILLDIRKNINIKIVCAHVNHNVRRESESEQEFLMNYCKEHDCVFEAMKIEKYGDDNFHNQARKIRYNFFEDLVKKYDANYLMTAHHGDDLIETILMRIVRGSTLKGYSGFDKIIDNGNYKVVRPLVFLTKDYIKEYDEKNGIPYVVDTSNFKGKYTRNRYRLSVLPFLKEEDKNVHEKFIKFNETLNEYDRFINNEIKKSIDKVYKNNQIDVIKYKELDILIKKKIIATILEDIYKEDLMIINDKHVKLIMDLIESRKSNSRICLPHNVDVIKSYDKVYFSKEIKEVIDYNIELIKYASLPNGHKLEVIDSCDSNNNDVCRILSSEVKLPLYVRTRKFGDKMYLKKIEGYKKVKDIFIDCKVPLDERDKWPIVVDSEDKIIWIPGLKKSKYTKLKNENYDIIIKYS
ncbi:MAG: tRNA lysidine(34) synthetase TilS [Bacilli bacterium]|nr:tRNA lysidine(34) synthetase TilS [Bacilli bacterium]